MRVRAASILLMLLWAVSTQAGTGSNLVVAAARAGDLTALRQALRQSQDVNVPDTDGTTALHWAAHHSDLAAIDLLLRAGAKVEARNRYGATPLWVAAIEGDAAALERLLRAGADPNTRMVEGDTALMNAARAGSADAIRVLLAHGADPNASERSKDQTALMWAAAENHTRVLEVLLEAGARINTRSKGGTLENPREGGYTALHFAARHDGGDSVKLLLRPGADVNERAGDGSTPLILAVASGHFDLAVTLLDAGANPDADGIGWSSLHELVWIRRPQTGLNHPGKVSHGKVDSLVLAKKLIEHGANVNARMTQEPNRRYIGRNPGMYVGATPLFVAAKSADIPLMKLLIANGADPNLRNAAETTPLMAAAGVGINGPGENPGTVEEITEAVRLCLQLGGDPNAADLNGDTALHGLALRGTDPAIELLVAAGARLNVRNKPRGSGGGGGQALAKDATAASSGLEGGFTPWRIAAGVFMNGAARQQLRTAELLRRMLEERGLPVE